MLQQGKVHSAGLPDCREVVIAPHILGKTGNFLLSFAPALQLSSLYSSCLKLLTPTDIFKYVMVTIL